MDRSEISHWFDDGLVDPHKPTFMIVVYEKYNGDYFPVYIYEDEILNEVIKKYKNHEMKEVIELYSFSVDKETQFKSRN